MELRSPLLLRLLRVPVRDQPDRLDRADQGHPRRPGPGGHRGPRPLSRPVVSGRLGFPGQPASQGRRGLDHLGALPGSHAGDERGHDPDRVDPVCRARKVATALTSAARPEHG